MARCRDWTGGGDGDLDRTDRGDEESGVEISDSGEDGRDDGRGIGMTASSMVRRLNCSTENERMREEGRCKIRGWIVGRPSRGRGGRRFRFVAPYYIMAERFVQNLARRSLENRGCIFHKRSILTVWEH